MDFVGLDKITQTAQIENTHTPFPNHPTFDLELDRDDLEEIRRLFEQY